MKALIYYIIFILTVSLTSCEEDALVPSMADKQFAKENPDMSKPLISDYKNNYGISIVYEFDLVHDYLFSFSDKNAVVAWNRLSINQFNSEQVDYGLEKLDELVFTYFKDEVAFQGNTYKSDFMKRLFPRAVFVVDSLAGEYKNLGQYIGELNNYESSKYFSFIWNDFEPMFAFNKDILSKATPQTISKYRNSIMYCLLSELFIGRKLYNDLPVSFFESVAGLYGASVNDLAIEENAEIIENGPRKYYAPEWYMSQGFVMTSDSPAAGYGTVTPYARLLDISRNYSFPDRERDLRNILHVIICETDKNNIRNYFKVNPLLPRIQTMILALYGYGIDVAAINPAIEEYFNE